MLSVRSFLRAIPILVITVSLAEASPESPGTESVPDSKQVEPKAELTAEPGSAAETPITASDVASSLKPNEADGLTVEDPAQKKSSVRLVGRVLLTLPRWGFALAMQPARAAVWAYERYQLDERFRRIFFNETETMGLFPSFFFETGFGFNAGLRFVHRDLFGKHESIHARAGFGGQYLQRYSLSADTGHRLRGVRMEISGDIELRDRDRFSGIGNRDLGSSAELVFPIDPLGDGLVVDSRYRQRFSRLWLAGHVPIAGPLFLRASAGVTDRKFSDKNVDARGEPVISDAYDLQAIPGFSENPRLGYAELEIRFASRRAATFYGPSVWWSTGWNLRAFGGPAKGLNNDASRFFRYGVDLQRYIDLFDSSRVLVLRAYGEGVSSEVGERVPFSELPTLGGKRLLRGYPDSRFRDRYVGEVSAEYQFDINAGSYGYLFIDTGKAMRRIDSDATEDLRHSFGGGIQINSQNSFLARVLIAGSMDGDFLLSLSYEPQFNLSERFDRK